MRFPWATITILLTAFFSGYGLQSANSEPTSTVQTADCILVEKSKRRLTLFSQDKIIKQYRVSLGKNPVGHKFQEGDGKTPEGLYWIDYRNPESRFHLSLRISYPNEKDIMRAMKVAASPGGDIMIHGIDKRFAWLGRLHRYLDWTDGCIAVTNREIEEIWTLVPVGTSIEIRP